jgi:hypothetical protein
MCMCVRVCVKQTKMLHATLPFRDYITICVFAVLAYAKAEKG